MVRINCDLCGKVEERLLKSVIEGVELDVCSACSKLGKVLGHIKKSIRKDPIKKIEEEKIEQLVEDYAEIIKKKRESMGLTQKDFANKVNEKETTIHKIETGTLMPPLPLAKKLEKILGLKLIEEYLEKRESFKRAKIDAFTLGDFIKIKK